MAPQLPSHISKLHIVGFCYHSHNEQSREDPRPRTGCKAELILIKSLKCTWLCLYPGLGTAAVPECISGTLNWKQHCCMGCASAHFLSLACNSNVPSAPSITSFGSSLKTLITFCTKTFLLNSLQARPLSQPWLQWLLQPFVDTVLAAQTCPHFPVDLGSC